MTRAPARSRCTTHDPTGDVTEAGRTWPAGARLHAGDFNGDGLADLAGYDALTGGGFLALRTGTTSSWSTLSGVPDGP